jgi:hypothetical protein
VKIKELCKKKKEQNAVAEPVFSDTCEWVLSAALRSLSSDYSQIFKKQNPIVPKINTDI